MTEKLITAAFAAAITVGKMLIILAILTAILYGIYKWVNPPMPFRTYAYKLGCKLLKWLNDIITRIFKW